MAAILFAAIVLGVVVSPAQGDEETCTWQSFVLEGREAIGCFDEGALEPVEGTVVFLDEAVAPAPITEGPPPIIEEEPAEDTPAEEPIEDTGGVDPAEPPTTNPTGGVSPNKPFVKPEKNEPSSVDLYQQSSVPNLDFSNFTIYDQVLSKDTLSVIDFPIYLLPIYEACGNQYNIPWEILASINRIETNFGELNQVTSSAGAVGWMQFMPSTWDMYGTDANRDGEKDPYNPVDAICSAARYLKAANFQESTYQAIWAYNHADWYVADVLEGARKYQALPRDIVSAITSLATPSFTPIKSRKGEPVKGGQVSRLKIYDTENIGFARAVTDAQVESSGLSKKFGYYVLLKDSIGNRFLYSNLAKGPIPKEYKELKKKSNKNRGRVPGLVKGGDNLARVKGHFMFSVRPAGRKSPWIDPRPLIKSWGVLNQVAFNKVKARQIKSPSLSQILMMPKSALEARVLENDKLEIYECGRSDIASGIIDRRVLALLEYLTHDGYSLTITSLQCGHSYLASSGNPSNHSFGRGVDIAAINGEPVYQNQHPGSLTEAVVLRILNLGGSMEPDELISLFNFGGPSWSDPVDHADHIHVGYSSGGGSGAYVDNYLDSREWSMIIDRISKLNPKKSKTLKLNRNDKTDGGKDRAKSPESNRAEKEAAKPVLKSKEPKINK